MMSDSGNGDRSGVVELVQGLINIDTDIAHLAHIAALSTHRTGFTGMCSRQQLRMQEESRQPN